MRFHFVTNFTGAALRRRFSVPYNQQYRAYTPFRHHPQFIKKISVSETQNHIPTSFSIFRRFCSSKSSNSRMGFLSWYLSMLESRPILTKSVSAALIYATADITSQLMTMKSDDTWDPIRTLRMTGFGFVILGPSQHLWFNFVARTLPKRDLLSTLKKLAMGQVAFAPTINGIFFSYNAAAQAHVMTKREKRMKKDGPLLVNRI